MSYKKAFVSCILLMLSCAGVCRAQTECKQSAPDKCLNWRFLVDSTLKLPDGFEAPDLKSDSSRLEGIACLLQLEGNRNRAKLGGTTNHRSSETYDPPTVEVAALYFISFLYYENWEYPGLASQLVKQGKDTDSREDIHRAYEAYRSWYKKVKEIGFAKAREQNLDPLDGTGMDWYGGRGND